MRLNTIAELHKSRRAAAQIRDALKTMGLNNHANAPLNIFETIVREWVAAQIEKAKPNEIMVYWEHSDEGPGDWVYRVSDRNPTGLGTVDAGRVNPTGWYEMGPTAGARERKEAVVAIAFAWGITIDSEAVADDEANGGCATWEAVS